MEAYVSMHSCQRDNGLPVYTETARLRVSRTNLGLQVGDTINYADREFSISSCREFPSACRTIIDVIRADLDLASAREFEHLQYTMRHGTFADEIPQHLGSITAVLVQDGQDIVRRHDSRQTVGTCRLFCRVEDAKKLTSLSLIRDEQAGREYKIVGVYDLGLIGKLPYAQLEETPNKLAR